MTVQQTTAAPISLSLRDAMCREAMRVSGMLDAGFPIERTALLISPAGDWRLPLPPLDDASIGTPITWAMVRVLATEFVVTIPDANELFNGVDGPIAVIGMAKGCDAAICIPPAVPALAENCFRFLVRDDLAAAMRDWLPKPSQTLTADEADIIGRAFGPGSPWELTREGEPQHEINTRMQ